MKETFLQFRRLSIDPLIKCTYAIHTIPSRLFSLARENPFVRSIQTENTLLGISPLSSQPLFPINPKLHAVHCLSIFPLIIRFSRERKNSRFLDCFTGTVSRRKTWSKVAWTFLPRVWGGWKIAMHPPRVYVRDGVNEFPSRHVRPVHCIYPYRIPIFECRPIARQGDHTPLPPLSFSPHSSYYVFAARRASSFSTPFAISPVSFFFFQPSFQNSIRLLFPLPVLENTPRSLASSSL